MAAPAAAAAAAVSAKAGRVHALGPPLAIYRHLEAVLLAVLLQVPKL